MDTQTAILAAITEELSKAGAWYPGLPEAIERRLRLEGLIVVPNPDFMREFNAQRAGALASHG